jgi:polynucleotide 5'-kinase involved in rRNA processing
VGLFDCPVGEEVFTTLEQEEFEYRLVGVEDLQGVIQGLGVVERLVSPELTAHIWMPPSVKEIAGLRFGEVRFDREEWQVIRDGASSPE